MTHDLKRHKIYPNYHFFIVNKTKMSLMANTKVREGDFIKDGGRLVQVTNITVNGNDITREILDFGNVKHLDEDSLYYEFNFKEINN